MEKEVKLAHERSVKVFADEDEKKPQINITECFYTDGLECAHYSLNEGENFRFSACLDLDLITEENENKLTFEIEIDHPLFFPLYHLLNDEKELIIKDEEDKDIEYKYLQIVNNEDKISLNFVDKTKTNNLQEKFVINCENKLDYFKDKETIMENELKKRLNAFFQEASIVLLEDSHQISFEEYDIKKKVLERQIS